ALMMVSQDLDIGDVMDGSKEIAFPESVVSMMRGDLGQPEGGWPSDIQDRVLKGDPAYTERPGALLDDIDLNAARIEAEETVGEKLSDKEFASYLMYPKVFADYALVRADYGPTAVLPTPVYFYGLEPGNEIHVDLEKGKTLVIRCLAVGETDDKGMVTVYFELNGQPRRTKVPDRAHGASGGAAKRKAEPGDDNHVGAPMPGVVSTVAIEAGQIVSAGDVLFSIEAMKMETAIHAERDGSIVEILVKTGDQIDAKDLLAVYATES
ncbi:MAG: biotin/lipoyl-containing protein, partial [Pseudomonadota bacterium]